MSRTIRLKKSAIIFATMLEACESIKLLDAKPDKQNSSVFYFDYGKIIISGCGCINALNAVYKFAFDSTMIVNVGIAGTSNSQAKKIGHIYKIKRVSKLITIAGYDIDDISLSMANNAFPEIILSAGATRLVTADFPVRRRIMREHDCLFDMEAYGVAAASNSIGICFEIYKLVSDEINASGRELIRSNMKAYSKELGKFIYKMYSSFIN